MAVGQAISMVDSQLRVSGSIDYTLNFELPRMLHACMLRSPHAHARVVKVDASRAAKLPGVTAVLTRDDLIGDDIDPYFGLILPADYIWQALHLLHVSRIDHGVRCMDDEALVGELVKRQVPLTVCPLSNVKLGVFARLEEHNLRQMLHRGLCVTVNSDDPAYFGGYIAENFVAAQQALHLTASEIYHLAMHSIQAAFLPAAKKQALLAQAAAVYNQEIAS